MDNIYDTLAKLNRVANRPEAKKIVKEDSHSMMKKGLRNLIDKSSKMNKQSTYKPFGKDDPDYETGLSKDAKKDKMFEKESDVERDDRAEKAGREVKRDAKYDHYHHAGKDGKSVTKDIEYDEKHHKDGMHEASKTMVKGPDGKMVPDYAVDGKGKDDLKEKGIVTAIGAALGNDAPDVTGSASKFDAVEESQLSESPAGDAVKQAYDAVYEFVGQYDDAALEYLDDNAPMFTQMFQKYEDLDVLVSKLNDATLMQLKDELDSVADDLSDGVLESKQSSGTLKDAARAGVMARLAELAGLPAQEIEEALGDSPEDTASRIMSEVSLDEEDTNEGNEFSGALAQAKKDGKAEFEVDGKKYKVEAIDSDEDAIQESDIDQIAEVGKVYPKIAKLKMKLVDDGMEPEDAHDEACEKYNVDPAMCDKYIEMQRDDRETKKVSEGGGRDMECGHCDGTGKHGDKDCKKCDGTGEAQEDDDPMNNESKVEETTSSGSVATSEAGGKALYKHASVYESNEIVKRAKQLNEDMSFTVSGGPDQEPTLNINASGTEAQQLGQLLKLSGLGMKPAAPQYGEVEIQVAEDQEFANGADDENTMDTEYMTQDIAGGLNGPKKMAYPKVAGGDNPMSVLEASELNEVGEKRLMRLYQAYKAK